MVDRQSRSINRQPSTSNQYESEFMAKDPLLPELPGEGDSWESLASNLLGINLNKPLDSEIVSPEELESLEIDLDEPPVEPPATPPEPPAAFPEEAAAEFEPAVDEPAVAEIEPVREAPAPATTDADRASDPYWDPLAEWEWDGEPSKRSARSKSTHREEPARPPERSELPAVAGAVEESTVKGTGADARRAADSFDTVSDYRDEYESGDEWEFGAGLLEGIAPPEPKTRQPADAEASSPPAPRESPPERPEREKRRDRVEETPHDRSERRNERTGSRDAPRPPEKREQREPAAPPAVARLSSDGHADDEDAFGAGLIDAASGPAASADDEPQEQRRPRRRSRRRGRSSKGEAPPESRTGSAERGPDAARSPAPSKVSRADLDDEDEDEEASDDASADSPYRNIPGWEEAISYLINPKRSADGGGESRSSERKKAASRSDSGTPGQSSGGRHRRRRPPR
jgi:hypothetical protein